MAMWNFIEIPANRLHWPTAEESLQFYIQNKTKNTTVKIIDDEDDDAGKMTLTVIFDCMSVLLFLKFEQMYGDDRL